MVSDDFSKPPEPRPSWRNEPWASREEKRAESASGKEPAWDWKEQRRQYERDPSAFEEKIRQQIRRSIDGQACAVKTWGAVKARGSADLAINGIQTDIDQMARACGVSNVPELIIYPDAVWADFYSKSPWDASIVVAASKTGDLITNAGTIRYLLQNPDQLNAVIAHELGHIANGDVSVEGLVSKLINPPNRKSEMLANYIGTIIQGNPREYARAMSRYYGIDEGKPSVLRAYDQDDLSPNGHARMLYKWADVLENEGAASKENGHIIDRDKAMQIFERSKSFTTAAANIDGFARS